MAFQWINVLVLQDLVQVGHLPLGVMAPVIIFVACFSLGLTLMPAYLDHKMNTVPEILPEGYYGEKVTVESAIVEEVV